VRFDYLTIINIPTNAITELWN